MVFNEIIEIDNIKSQSNEDKLAVHSSDLIVNFGSLLKPQLSLNKLSIEIPRGCIYGLIGPSGSGKTTLQRTIIGAVKPTSGSLKVYGSTPGSKGSSIPGPLVGYMPQDIALDDDLTVTEMLTFLGRINGLSSEIIESKCKKLCEIMSIDELDKRLVNFSTGQRRRLSLACSLIHSPELLLLDEPTVGSDIVLVHNIWNYLRHLNESQGTTIIMTTHYLEEVTHCDAFGFLSNGQILYHGHPRSFMDSVNATTFEQAIIVYCCNNKQQQITASDICNNKDGVSIIKSTHQNLARNAADARKKPLSRTKFALILSWRYLMLWKFKLLIPYLILTLSMIPVCYFMSSFFGVPLIGLKLAYINLSNSTSEYVFSFTNYLENREINLVKVNDEMIGRSLVESGLAGGYFIIPEEFDLGLKTRVASALSSSADESLQLSGRITLYQDTTHAVGALTITNRMYKSLDKLMSNIVTANGLTSNRLEFIKISGVIERTDEPDRMASKPIFIIRLFGFFLETYSLMVFLYWTIQEYHEPIFERLISVAITRNHLAMVSLVLSTLFLTPAYLVDFILSNYISGIPSNGNYLLIMPIMVCCVICGLCKAILIGSIVNSHVIGLILALFYSCITWCFGCVSWPYETVPYFIQPLTYLVPNMIPSDAIIRISIYGDGLGHPQVTFGYIYSIGMALLHVILVLIVNRKTSL